MDDALAEAAAEELMALVQEEEKRSQERMDNLTKSVSSSFADTSVGKDPRDLIKQFGGTGL